MVLDKRNNGISFVLACVAIMISLVSAFFTWNQTQSPPKIEFNAGLPIISQTHYESSEKLSFTPIIPLNISNSGAKGGLLKDVRVVVKTAKENKTWLLSARYFCSEYGISGMNQENREAFHSLFVQGKESMYKVVLFYPVLGYEDFPVPVYSPSTVLPNEDTWTLEYYVLDSSSSDYRLVQKQDFNLSDAQIRNGSYVPDSVEAQSTIERFVKKLRQVLKH